MKVALTFQIRDTFNTSFKVLQAQADETIPQYMELGQLLGHLDYITKCVDIKRDGTVVTYTFDILEKGNQQGLDKLRDLAHQTAKEKGWWDSPRDPLSVHMLLVSEIAEATEDVRNDREDYYYDGDKPQGEAVELADCVIRIADYFGHNGWSLDEIVNSKLDYNISREYRHGNKKY